MRCPAGVAAALALALVRIVRCPGDPVGLVGLAGCAVAAGRSHGVAELCRLCVVDRAIQEQPLMRVAGRRLDDERRRQPALAGLVLVGVAVDDEGENADRIGGRAAQLAAESRPDGSSLDIDVEAGARIGDRLFGHAGDVADRETEHAVEAAVGKEPAEVHHAGHRHAVEGGCGLFVQEGDEVVHRGFVDWIRAGIVLRWRHVHTFPGFQDQGRAGGDGIEDKATRHRVASNSRGDGRGRRNGRKTGIVASLAGRPERHWLRRSGLCSEADFPRSIWQRWHVCARVVLAS